MWLPFSYSHMLLIFILAGLFVLVVFLLRRHWLSHPAGLQSLGRGRAVQDHELYSEYVVPLMVYEERYPSFGKIVSLVLGHFPLIRFLRQESFQSALVFLREAAFQPAGEKQTARCMSVVIQSFLEDPDVEYRCRRQLPALVREFLNEIDG